MVFQIFVFHIFVFYLFAFDPRETYFGLLGVLGTCLLSSDVYTLYTAYFLLWFLDYYHFRSPVKPIQLHFKIIAETVFSFKTFR